MSEQRNAHAGKPIHWVEIAAMVVGSAVSGMALIAGSWTVFWIGVAVVVVAGIAGLATDIFGDVVLDEPRVVPELSHSSGRRRPEYRAAGPTDTPFMVPDDTPRAGYVADVDSVEVVGGEDA